MGTKLALAAWCALLASCAVEPSGSPRSEVMARAEAYRTHVWTASSAQVRHGPDPDGVIVETPDASFRPGGKRTQGWWKPGERNVGVPYQWGGFDTLEMFDQKLAAGYYAGDAGGPEKRRLLDNAVSKYACGVDCAGFICRCLGLTRLYSTRDLHAVCERVHDWSDLEPGDVLVRYNDHAMLVYKFLDPDRTKIAVYETGSPPVLKVVRRWYEVAQLKRIGFIPLRFRGLADR